MTNRDYNKLALEIFGEKAFENPEAPLADAEQFATVAEELFDKLEPEQKDAVVKMLEGEELSADETETYAMGIRYLKHPCRSRKLKPFIAV